MATAGARTAVSGDELRAILAGHQAFAGVSQRSLDALARVAEREFVPAGAVLLASGAPPDSAFVVEHGRLRGRDERVSASAGHEVAIEFGRGDVCALGLLVAQLPIAGWVVAMRDSTVLRLRGGELLRCIAAHPELVVAQARQLYETALRTHTSVAAGPRIFTLMPVGAPFAIGRVVDPLLRALSQTLGPGSAIDSRRVAEVVGVAPEEQGTGRFRRRLSEWCSAQEEHGRLLLLVCDREDTPWTRWCLEQTDRILVAARADDHGAIEQVRRTFAGRSAGGAPVEVDLLLLHEPGVEVPRGTPPWLELDRRRRHHHVRIDRSADFERAARRIGERAIGVVLGGGGARALAHIGVLQALEDAGVPVDIVGGTSMGSVVAAGYARGWSPREMLALFAEQVPDGRALRDLAFPKVSLFAGRKLDRVLQFAFEDLDVSDLWRSCFHVSADLGAGRMVVHDRGPLWRTVRASCSLPGVFPPVRADGQLLVDGGVVDNVPIAFMKRENAGSTIIAVDVGSAGLGATGAPVNILHVLTSATTLGSKEQLQDLVAHGDADLFLVPPVQHIKLLGFDARDSLFDIGYRYAREQLAAWSGLARLGSVEPARSESAPSAPSRPTPTKQRPSQHPNGRR